MKKVKCIKCGSENVQSFDNEPLHHPHRNGAGDTLPYDNEVTIIFKCLTCQSVFKEIFDLKEKPLTSIIVDGIKFGLENTGGDGTCFDYLDKKRDVYCIITKHGEPRAPESIHDMVDFGIHHTSEDESPIVWLENIKISQIHFNF